MEHENDPNAFFTHMWGNQKKLFPNMPAIIKAKNSVKKIIQFKRFNEQTLIFSINNLSIYRLKIMQKP